MFSCEDKNENNVVQAPQDTLIEKIAYYYADTDIPWIYYYYDVVGEDTVWVKERWLHDNGQLQLEGNIVDNQREGEFRGYYPSGKLMSVGSFVKDKREGKGKIYFENGVVNIENEYRNGKPYGLWYYYNEEGELVDVQEYK